MARLYSGTSGLVLPVPNKQAFPTEFKDKTRLSYYASLFNSIEINSSFYKIPKGATVSKWATEVPDDFRFTFKLWQGITHNKSLEFDNDCVQNFITVINNSGHKKGSLLVQLPPSVTRNQLPRLHHLLEVLRNTDHELRWDIAVEFRHKSWYNETTWQLLNNLRMGLVLHDLPASATPFVTTEVNFVYLRFHGPNGGYRGSYPDDVLQEYTGYIKEWFNEGKKVYAYFNNTIGDAVHNLATLNTFVNGQV